MTNPFRGTFRSLRNHNFKLFFFGQSISNTGNWLTNVALTLLVLKLTGSGLAIGILAACQYGPLLIFSAWAGAIADRADKRRFLFVTQSLEMAESVGLAALAFMPHPPLVGLYALALMGGVLLSFDNPLRRSFVSEMVPHEDVPNAVVLYSTIVNLSRVLGPTLAGVLIITAGYGWCFTVDALSYLAVLWSLYLMHREELYRAPTAPKKRGEVREGLRYVFREPRLLATLIMLAGIGALSLNASTTFPLLITKSLGGAEGIFTFMYAIYAAGGIFGAFFIARRESVRLRHIVYGATLFGISMLVLSAAPGVPSAVALAFFVGAGSVLYTTATTTLLQVEADPHMRGRVLALQSLLLIGPKAFGAPLLGYLADVFGGRMPLVVGGVACLITAVYGYRAVAENPAHSAA